MANKNKREKKLTPKQKLAIELLTSGTGMKYKDIAAEVGVNPKTLWDWRNEPEFTHFQEELKRAEDEWLFAALDAARASAMRLVAGDNQKMTEFILKTGGYNPTQKIEADVSTNIVINIGDDEDDTTQSEA